MVAPPKQLPLPLTEAEIAEGRALGEAWHRAREAFDAIAAERDAWFVRMERKYRDRYEWLPTHLTTIAGASRWTYSRAVRKADKRERSA